MNSYDLDSVALRAVVFSDVSRAGVVARLATAGATTTEPKSAGINGSKLTLLREMNGVVLEKTITGWSEFCY
jgi:hypothetical protein